MLKEVNNFEELFEQVGAEDAEVLDIVEDVEPGLVGGMDGVEQLAHVRQDVDDVGRRVDQVHSLRLAVLEDLLGQLVQLLEQLPVHFELGLGFLELVRLVPRGHGQAARGAARHLRPLCSRRLIARWVDCVGLTIKVGGIKFLVFIRHFTSGLVYNMVVKSLLFASDYQQVCFCVLFFVLVLPS